MANPRTIARLQARIHERAAHCLQFEIKDPRASFITITRVELSSDIASGKIYYSVLGDESEQSKAAHMLAHAAGYIQRQVARVLDLRRMPHLRWVFDESALMADDLAHLISEARARDLQINPNLAAEELAEGEAGETTLDVAHDTDEAQDADEVLEREDAPQPVAESTESKLSEAPTPRPPSHAPSARERERWARRAAEAADPEASSD